MRTISAVLFLLSVVPSVCHAITSIDINSIICTGSQTSTLSCIGDFSLSGGSISADSKVLLTSSGALTLDNLTIFAPEVEFIAGSLLSLGAGVSITSNSFYASIGDNSTVPVIAAGATISIGGEVPRPLSAGEVRPLTGGSIPITNGGVGGIITIAPSIPEPSSYVTMLAGLLALGGMLRTKSRHVA